MATDRREILTTFADKIAAREYVRQRVGDHVLPHVYAITRSPETLQRSELPRTFVVKPSHGSAGLIVVGAHVSPENHLPQTPVGWQSLHVHPDSLDWDRLIGICRHWMTLRWHPDKQWAYGQIEPRVLVEELLLSDGRIPLDYKFLVFHGTVGVIWVDQARFEDHRRNFYSPRWERLDVEYVYPSGPDDPRPTNLVEMIAVAERLADDIDFIRVDLYSIGERIVFGELTACPEGGAGVFVPAEFDEDLGALWRLDASGRRGLIGRRRN